MKLNTKIIKGLVVFLWGAAAWGQDVVIGQCAPLSGSLASTGREMAGGAQLAFEEANAQGGVNGVKIKHYVQDDGYDTARTLACSRDLIQNLNAVALIGYAGTGNIYELLAKKVLADAEIALIAPGSGSKALREPFNPYIFHIRAGYEDEAKAIVEHVVGAGGAKRVAVFYQDDPFGKSGLESVQKALKARGLDPVSVGTYDKNNENVDAAVASVLAGQPQAVIMVAISRPTGVFLKKLKEQAPGVSAFALSVVIPQEIEKISGPASARGLGISQVVPYPFTKPSPMKIVQDYQNAMAKFSPGTPLTYTGFELYIGGRVLVDALRRVNPPYTRAAVLKALDSTQLDLGGHKIKFDAASRAGSRFVEMTMLSAGGRLMR